MGIFKTLSTVLAVVAAKKTDPDAFKSLEQIATENGFVTQGYTLTTPDDYILSLYRIPGTIQEQAGGAIPQKPAVLIVHAQDCDMMEWVWNDEQRANAFILSRAGYDVWLGNNRGNKYSNTHKTLSSSDKAYWDFYQEDMGLKDLPTFMDHILDTTGLETLSYIGHSEGTTQFFMGASLNPTYFTERVNLFVALAPVASTSNIPIWYIKIAAFFINELQFLLVDVFNYANWFAPMPRAQKLIVELCDDLGFICRFFAGFLDHDSVDNGDRFDVFMSNEPSGQSYRTFVYYAQMINDKRNFVMYDYGKKKNQELYHQDKPPLVPIENFNVPTVLLSGDLDKLADPTDVAWISKQLGEKVVFQKEYHNDHFTFAIGKDMSFFSQDAVDQLHIYNPVSSQYLQ